MIYNQFIKLCGKPIIKLVKTVTRTLEVHIIDIKKVPTEDRSLPPSTQTDGYWKWSHSHSLNLISPFFSSLPSPLSLLSLNQHWAIDRPRHKSITPTVILQINASSWGHRRRQLHRFNIQRKIHQVMKTNMEHLEQYVKYICLFEKGEMESKKSTAVLFHNGTQAFPGVCYDD